MTACALRGAQQGAPKAVPNHLREIYQFMAVLELVRDTCDDDVLAYADPLTKIDF